MLKLTQNHKIAISVAAIFMISLSIMLFLLGGNSQNMQHLKTSVSHSSESSNTETEMSAKYKNYFSEPSDLVFAVDAAGKFTYASEEFCELIKSDCKLLSGKLFFKYVNEEDLADFASTHAKIVKEENDSQGLGPFRLQKANGEKGALVMLSVHAVLDSNKEISEIVFCVKDITKKVDDMNIDVKEIESQYPKTSQEEDEDARPGDSRLMVDKISFLPLNP